MAKKKIHIPKHPVVAPLEATLSVGECHCHHYLGAIALMVSFLTFLFCAINHDGCCTKVKVVKGDQVQTEHFKAE